MTGNLGVDAEPRVQIRDFKFRRYSVAVTDQAVSSSATASSGIIAYYSERVVIECSS